MWHRIRSIIIILWFLLFVASFLIKAPLVNGALIVVGALFVLELLVEFMKAKSKRKFIKEQWHEIIFLIPIFKVFKLGKIAKFLKMKKATKLSKAIKVGEKVYEGVDIGLSAKKDKT